MKPRVPLGRRRLVTIGTSLALHAGLVLAVLLAVNGETEVGTLFIDLTERGHSKAAGPAFSPAAGPARRGRARALRPTVAARSAPVPSTPPSSAEPPPAAEPVASRDTGAESPALPARSATSAPAEASAPQQASPAAEAGDASAVGGVGGTLLSSDAVGPDGPVTASEVFSGRGVGDGAPGAPDVSQGFALAVAGGGAGGPSSSGAEYGVFLGRLRARVQQSLRYPLAARRRGLSGTVNVEIVIRPDGAISAVAVADSSSHAVLDDAAVETIRRLAPEPLPRDVPPRTLRVRLPVVFALE